MPVNVADPATRSRRIDPDGLDGSQLGDAQSLPHPLRPWPVDNPRKPPLTAASLSCSKELSPFPAATRGRTVLQTAAAAGTTTLGPCHLH